MKIAINCIYYTPKGGGITEYIHNLIKELTKLNHHHNFIIYVNREAEKQMNDIVGGNARIKTFPFLEAQKYKRSLFQQRYWTGQEKTEKFDLFHSPFFHAPKFKHARVVLTVHDLRFLNYPLSYKLLRLIYLLFEVKRSIKKAEHIIAISQFTKNEIVKHYHVDGSKIEVIHEAVDAEGFKISNNLSTLTISNTRIERNKYILAVGHIEPRKNYLNLIKAYSKLPSSIRENYRLIIVGKKNHNYKKVLDAIKSTEDIHYLNFITREELTWLYANCKIHAFPSFYEGFGFPSLEAGLFGKPTVGANQSSIPEVAGKGSLYFNPFSTDEIKQSLQKLLGDDKLYNKIANNAAENVKQFSWEENAKKTLRIYNQIEKCLKEK